VLREYRRIRYFRMSHPEIDWTGMAGFRDVLIQSFGDAINEAIKNFT